MDFGSRFQSSEHSRPSPLVLSRGEAEHQGGRAVAEERCLPRGGLAAERGEGEGAAGKNSPSRGPRPHPPATPHLSTETTQPVLQTRTDRLRPQHSSSNGSTSCRNTGDTWGRHLTCAPSQSATSVPRYP